MPSPPLRPVALWVVLFIFVMAGAATAAPAVTFGTPQKEGDRVVSLPVYLAQEPYMLSLYHFKLYKNGVIQDWGDATLTERSSTEYSINFNTTDISSGDTWTLNFENTIWPVCEEKDISFPTFGTADVSSAQTIGDGSSCTQAQIEAALQAGGVYKFNCGTQPVTITINKELKVNYKCGTYPCKGDLNTPPYLVLDGQGLVTLKGAGSNRFLVWNESNYGGVVPRIVIQNLKFTNFKALYSGNGAAAGGGAIYIHSGGSLDLLNCDFWNNVGPAPACSAPCSHGPGQDTAGGALNFIGGAYLRIKNCRFWGNSCSNGGAVGTLQAQHVYIWNTWIFNNKATGLYGNPGNGGNGGGISMDGRDGLDLQVCGLVLANNQGGTTGSNGGGLFRTDDNSTATEISTFNNALFDRNTVANTGSALYLEYGSPIFKNSIFTRNTGGSGNIHITPNINSGEYNNCMFVENINLNGGALALPTFTSSGAVDHITVAANYANYSTGAVYGTDQSWTISNSALSTSDCTNQPCCSNSFQNGGNNFYNCDPHGNCGSTGTLSDPMFPPLASNDFCILPASGTAAAKAGSGATCNRNLQRLYLLTWASDKSLAPDDLVTITLEGGSGSASLLTPAFYGLLSRGLESLMG